MTEPAALPHLRLVLTINRGQETTDKPLRPQEKQLCFPYPEESTVFLIYLDSIGRDQFARIMGDFIPRWIIDVRAVPRLDNIAASRLSAFTLFERTKASYIDLFGRLGIRSYRVAESHPTYWSRALFDVLKNADRTGPYFFLFDNKDLLRKADDVLPEVIQAVVGKVVQFAHILNSDGMKNAPME